MEIVRDPWLPPELLDLPPRQGAKPRLDIRFPCLQLEDRSPEEVFAHLLASLSSIPDSTVALLCHPRYPADTRLLLLDESVAKGQPEAFLHGFGYAIVRPDGSTELRLRPEWAALVLARHWCTIHPLARYMAGAVPPQTLILFAPRDQQEVSIIQRIITCAAWYARGHVHGVPLPDSRW